MSGHSKWANIKVRKGKQDAKKGQEFTKAVNEIIIAVKSGGGADEEMNSRLRFAILRAKSVNMPNDNIQRAIDKAVSKMDGSSLEEISYEAYAPAGVALIVNVATDNRNRTLPNVKSVITKAGGKMATPGSVAYMFAHKGIISVAADITTEDKLMEITIDAGAEDILTHSDGSFDIITPIEKLHAVANSLEKNKISFERAELSLIAENKVDVRGSDAEKILKLIDLLEDTEDVQQVYGNHIISDDELERIYGNDN